MKKKIQKPFDAEAAKNGAKVKTKFGDSVRILCYDRLVPDYPILALVNYGTFEMCYSYTIDGKLCKSGNDNKDLVIIDEIESKFYEGDYIVGEVGIVYKITEIDDMYHTTQLSSGYKQRWTIEDIESNFHKWTIQDTKVGDILTIIKDKTSFIFKGCLDKNHPNHPTAFCGIDSLNNFVICNHNYWWTNHDVRPATKEEKELFFEKLKEEGYKFNSNSLILSKVEKWRDDENANVNGYFIDNESHIVNHSSYNNNSNRNVFATEKQAKAALAMARISQIMANDKRFGGAITDEEWNTDKKYIIMRIGTKLEIETRYCYEYLAFHTIEQARLFLSENEDLVKDYYMLD